MNWKKLSIMFTLCLKGSATQRADYLRKKGVFALMGENVSYSMRSLPLYPNLISIHDNVRIAAGVHFITHDISDNVINQYLSKKGNTEQVGEKIGCIEIMDNVFIGANVTIMYDVRIGSNSIIGAGSIVTKDIPPNSIAVGVPCRVIGLFEGFVEKRIAQERMLPVDLEMPVRGVRVPTKTANYLWNVFLEERLN